MTNRLALTCGDAAGVGPEIIADWLRRHPEEAEQVCVIGPGGWLGQLDSGCEKITVGVEGYEAVPGRPTGESALVAWAAMERAAAGCGAGEFAGVVTGPVSKAGLAAIGFPFPGQTEFFGDRWGGEPVMAFAGGRLRVVLVTWHVPLRQVPALLDPIRLRRTVRAAAELARADGIAQPRIACCGLNPHAGEDGLLGSEEREQLNPWLAELRPEYPGLSDCQPGDTVFGRALRGEFDVVIALYHDQGLGPLKTLEFELAVNLTLGLPHVRTSPDHGTAFGIAGKGRADGRSFANAVTLARRLIDWRVAETP